MPSSTSVNDIVSPLLVTLETTRSLTTPGFSMVGVPVIAALPLWPSLVAVIAAVPAATPVTRPVPFTVATAGVLLAHVTTRPLKPLPLASLGVAASCTVPPAATLAVAGLTATDATGAAVRVTATAAPPLCPSLVAVIATAPAATPVTSPLLFTAATAGALLTHAIARPLNELPLASLGVAVSCTFCPTAKLDVAGLTVT